MGCHKVALLDQPHGDVDGNTNNAIQQVDQALVQGQSVVQAAEVTSNIKKSNYECNHSVAFLNIFSLHSSHLLIVF